jgi:FkbM family methyltransferase
MLPNCELVKVDGTQFLVFKGIDLISNHLKKALYENDIHQLALKLLINEPDGLVLDIGANLGTFCVPLARKIPKLKFHAFEPQRIIGYQLGANIIINSLDNVTTSSHALSDGYKSLEIKLPDYLSEANIGAFSIDPEVRANDYECGTAGEVQQIETCMLDDYAFTNVRLIKIDVEGHELEVLRGAETTLEVNKFPPIIFEAWTWKPWYQEKRQEVFKHLTDLGYKIRELGENNLAQHPAYESTHLPK